MTEQKSHIFSIRVHKLDTHAHCTLFVNHALSGKFVMRKEELPAFLLRLKRGQAHPVLTDTNTKIENYLTAGISAELLKEEKRKEVSK